MDSLYEFSFNFILFGLIWMGLAFVGWVLYSEISYLLGVWSYQDALPPLPPEPEQPIGEVDTVVEVSGPAAESVAEISGVDTITIHPELLQFEQTEHVVVIEAVPEMPPAEPPPPATAEEIGQVIDNLVKEEKKRPPRRRRK